MRWLAKFKKVFGIIGIRGVVKSIWFNFRYVPIPLALKIPVILSSNVEIRNCHRGGIIFKGGENWLFVNWFTGS